MLPDLLVLLSNDYSLSDKLLSSLAKELPLIISVNYTCGLTQSTSLTYMELDFEDEIFGTRFVDVSNEIHIYLSYWSPTVPSQISSFVLPFFCINFWREMLH